LKFKKHLFGFLAIFNNFLHSSKQLSSILRAQSKQAYVLSLTQPVPRAFQLEKALGKSFIYTLFLFIFLREICLTNDYLAKSVKPKVSFVPKV